MKPSSFARIGDDYLVTWSELGVALQFSRVRETESSIYAIVAAVSAMPETRGKAIMAPSRLNLWELSPRERLAKALAERTGVAAVDWKDSVEWAFKDTIEAVLQPEPLVRLAEVQGVSMEGGYLIWPLLAEGQDNILFADGKVGKSYLAQRLAVCVATGNDNLPAPLKLHGGDGKGRSVFYYDSETDQEAQWRRLCRVCASLGLKQLPRNIFYRRLTRPLPDMAAQMRAEIDREGGVLAIIDSLTFAAGGDLNKTEVAVPAMNACSSLGCTRLLLAHHSKAGRENNASPSVMGSATFEFKSRNLWLARRVALPGARIVDLGLYHMSVNDGPKIAPIGLSMEFNESNTQVSFRSTSIEEHPELAKHGTAEQKIMGALLETETWKATTKELEKATGLPEGTVRRTLASMDRVRQAGGGGGRGNVAVWEVIAGGGRERFTARGGVLNLNPPKPFKTAQPNGLAENGGEEDLESLPF